MGKRKTNIGILMAIKKAGSQENLARLMQVSQPAIAKWLYVNCTAERAVEIEKKVGVNRKHIRPDLF